LRSGAEALAFLRTVDAPEADTLRALVVQNFEHVAVHDSNHLGLVFGDSKSMRGSQERDEHNEGPYGQEAAEQTN
ncbi:MAG TPA: hypothetical protein VN657_07910, partial [Nitrospiraceae bacterium]|nr:hypothetical protein [Nitrospiraceae bacterium]